MMEGLLQRFSKQFQRVYSRKSGFRLTQFSETCLASIGPETTSPMASRSGNGTLSLALKPKGCFDAGCVCIALRGGLAFAAPTVVYLLFFSGS